MSFARLYFSALLLRSTRTRPANTSASRRAPIPSASCFELASKRGAELEQWSLKKEKSYFREVLRRDLVVEVA